MITKPLNTRFDGMDTDENVLYAIRRSHVFNIPWVALAILLVISPFFLGPYVLMLDTKRQFFTLGFTTILVFFWYLITFGFIFQNFLNWFFNVYIISTKRIMDIDFKGLLYKSISEAPLRNIEDVTSRVVGTIGVIFNVGDVFLQTSAEQREFEFEGVDDPSTIRDIISDMVTEMRHR